MILNFFAWHRRYSLRERRNSSEAPDTTDSTTDLVGIDVSDVLSPRIAYCFVFLCIKIVNAESALWRSAHCMGQLYGVPGRSNPGF